MDKETKAILQNQSAKHIADLFTNHNINCSIDENKILFDKEQISIEIYCFDKNSTLNLKILQLDVYINYGINAILESFAGLGDNFTTANLDAFENFKNNSFHTILSAFFLSKFDKEIQKDNWEINGKNFEIFSSNLGIRGTKPTSFSTEWLTQLNAEIQKLQLEEGVHWVRLLYAQNQNQTTACEVLLDNEPCLLIQEKAEKFLWNRQEEFYSVRVFMILKNGIDFGRVVKIIGNKQEYKDVFSSLNSIGLSELEIEKAYSFIPEAFGRKLIRDMGVAGNFSNEAIIMNDKKEQFGINLSDEIMYNKATILIDKLTKTGWNDDIKHIAFMSASFNALNSALNGGAKLEDIACESFNTIFLISTHSETKPYKQKKPFWKFW